MRKTHIFFKKALFFAYGSWAIAKNICLPVDGTVRPSKGLPDDSTKLERLLLLPPTSSLSFSLREDLR